MIRYAAVAALVAASLGLGTGVASAGQQPSHNGYYGSCNMVQDPTMDATMNSVILPAGFGHGNNGNIGMSNSTFNSGSNDSCPQF